MSHYYLNKQSFVIFGIFLSIGKRPFCRIHLDESCHLADICALMKVARDLSQGALFVCTGDFFWILTAVDQ